jgi:hypothetical protein
MHLWPDVFFLKFYDTVKGFMVVNTTHYQHKGKMSRNLFMKGDMMKSDSQPELELELSEEHLQEITGGCAQCVADVKQMKQHLTLAGGYAKIADTKDIRGKDSTLYDNLFKGHVNAMDNIIDRVEARGHITLSR